MIFKKASRLLQESLKQLAVAGNLRPYHIMGSPGSKNRLEALQFLIIGCIIAEKCCYNLKSDIMNNVPDVTFCATNSVLAHGTE